MNWKTFKKFYSFNFVDFLNIRRIFICLEKGKKKVKLFVSKKMNFFFHRVGKFDFLVGTKQR